MRQLERRRVLDAALQSLIVAPTVAADGPDPVATAVTSEQPLVFDWTASEVTSDSAAAVNAFAASTQGGSGGADGPLAASANNPPEVIVFGLQQVNEGELLDLSGTSGGPSLGLIIDESSDSHTAAVNWGDAPLNQFDTLTVFPFNGIGKPIGGPNAIHTYADGDAPYTDYTVTVRAADQFMSGDFENGTDGVDFVEATFIVRVNNVAPQDVNAGLDQTVDEGDTVSLGGTFTDPGSADTHTFLWTVSADNGQLIADGTSQNFSFVPNDNGTYTIIFRVTDDDGEFNEDEVIVSVNNVAPQDVNAGLDQTVDEGDTVSLGGTFTDPGSADTHTFLWTVSADNGQLIADGTSQNFSFVPNDNGTYTIIFRVTDDDGEFNEDEVIVSVNNVAPQDVNAGLDQTVDEGDTVSLGGTFTDPGSADTHTFLWTVSADNGQLIADGTSQNFSFVPNDNGTYTIIFRVTDDDGEFNEDEVIVSVDNVAPTITIDGDADADEGSQYTLNLSSSDLGEDAITSWEINWGDGNIETVSGNPSTAIHNYADDGVYTITATATDEDGTFPAINGQTGDNSVEVTVDNDDPDLTVTPTTPTSILEGGSVSFSATFSDPGFDNADNPLPGGEVEESFTYDIDWGDGRDAVSDVSVSDSGGMPGSDSTGSFGGSHTYADDGLYTVTVTIHDDDGGFLIRTFTVDVDNDDPDLTVTPTTPTSILEGGSVSFSATFSDPGFDNADNPLPGGEVEESFTYDIDWGDGRDAVSDVSVSDSGGMPGSDSTGSFGGSHTYADDGLYTVTVTIHDDDGGFLIRTFTVDVDNDDPDLTVTPTTPTSILEGGSVSFSATFSDPGFDNADNPLPGGEVEESFTYDIDWGDGRDAVSDVSVSDSGGMPGSDSTGSFGGSHTYADDGLYTVTVTIHDDDGGFLIRTFTVDVDNDDPDLTVTPTTPTSILEGGSVSFSATFSDPGFDNADNPLPGGEVEESFTYDIDWGDGRDAVSDVSVSDSGGMPGSDSTGSFGGSHTYADDGLYTVTVTIHDDDGGFLIRTFTVDVDNDDPDLTVTPTTPTSILEGGSVSFSATFSDPGFDNADNPLPGGEVEESFTYDIDWGDGRDAVSDVSVSDSGGMPGSDSTGSFGGSHTYADDGLYTVTVTIHDDDGGFLIRTFTVDVDNDDPDLTVTPTTPTSILEGGSVSFSATFSDPGFDNADNPLPGGEVEESFTYDIDWGDGRDAVSDVSVSDSGGMPGSDSTGSFGGSHTYADDGLYTVTVTIHDDDGGFLIRTFTVDVDNDDPDLTVTPTTPTSILEGGSVSFSATFSDPGFDNADNPLPGGEVEESFTYDIDWGDGRDAVSDVSVSDSGGMPGSDSTGSFGGSHTYADDGLYTVTVTIHDDDGGFLIRTFTVDVDNDDPDLTVTPTTPTSILEGGSVSFSATFSDPGFDNADNPLPGGEVEESFTYDIDWGDGRDAVSDVSVSDSGGMPGSDSTGSFGGSHTYADDGLYTVTVTIHDDDGGFLIRTFTVDVDNDDPDLTDADPLNVVNEGEAFVLSNLGGSTLNMGIGLTDPGFDNPDNPTTPALGDPLFELFKGDTIDWGDGTANTPVTVVMRDNGEPNTPTTALFQHAAHTYADNGVYTVRVRVADDNMGAYHDPQLFTTGTPGVDFVDLEFTIIVNNVSPTLAVPVTSAVSISENGSVNFSVSFSDPGFDNAANDNAPPNGGEVAETFTYDIDWGDNRHTVGDVTIGATPGGVGVLSEGSFTGDHIYADDGTYTVTVTIHDDDEGIDTQVFTIVVSNSVPAFVPTPDGASFEGDDVTSTGFTTIRVSFRDAGFDNTVNPNASVLPNISNTKHESFTHVLDWGDGTIDAIHTYVDGGTYAVTVTVAGADLNGTFTFTEFVGSTSSVLTLVGGQTLNVPGATAYTYEINWGDGTIQTVTLMLNEPLAPLAGNGRTTVFAALRTPGDEGLDTTGSFEVQHQYLGPPNPANATADIQIRVMVVDDNNSLVSDFILITNPGIDTVNVAIDTTAQVPRLEFAAAPVAQVLLVQPSSAIQSLQSTDVRVARAESNNASQRYLELVVVSPDGEELKSTPIPDESLLDLRGLFARLPDGRYKIYLVRSDNNSRRLVIDVNVRSGRIIDRADESEGTRDRPPTGESAQPNDVVPLEGNPLLEEVPATDQPDAAQQPRTGSAVTASVDEETPPAVDDLTEITAASLRWGIPMAGLAFARGLSSWSQELDAALEGADERRWQSLRRAGRTGRLLSRNPRKQKASRPAGAVTQ